MNDLKFTETFDRHALFYIIRNFNDIYKPTNKTDEEKKGILTGLRQYLKAANQNGTIELKYNKKAYGFGRVYAEKYSLQNMPRLIRNSIARSYVRDYERL